MGSVPDQTVFIVDDDASVRDALGLLLGLRGYRTALFACAEDFLKARQAGWCGCVLLDIRMPGMDGIALQQRLAELGDSLPVIIITGHGDVDLARQAFRARAVDFLEKPLDEQKLVAAIQEAFSRQAQALETKDERQRVAEAMRRLTQREQEVMKLVIAGRRNTEISAELAISVRTVEAHKSNLMAKLGVDNIPDLMRLSLGR
jgi:RNA polymerase sigma factor (sigma-70 family)